MIYSRESIFGFSQQKAFLSGFNIEGLMVLDWAMWLSVPHHHSKDIEFDDDREYIELDMSSFCDYFPIYTNNSISRDDFYTRLEELEDKGFLLAREDGFGHCYHKPNLKRITQDLI